MTKFINRFQYVKGKDILHIFLFVIALPFSLIFRIFHRNLWLICDDGNDARDNGYWLFKYVREHHPEIDCVYALKKDSPDNNRVKELGMVIPYGTFKHWIYYLSASKNISSQKSGKPNAAVCYFLEISGILNNKRVFLQHGITKDNIKAFYYEVCKFSLFVTAVPRETEYIENVYGYKNKGIVKQLGFCRFDNLQNFRSVYKTNQILLMPTWREWIVRPVASSYDYDDVSNFSHTEYFKTYQSLLLNHQLSDMLKAYNITLIFYPHKGMQPYLSYFHNDNPNIIFADWHRFEVQQLLMESALLITDYSSVAFDFAYMNKPLLYYQFDVEKVRERHYQEGYFSYERDGFGEVCKTENELIERLTLYCRSQFALSESYKNRIENFFTLQDDKNCERNFQAILEL